MIGGGSVLDEILADAKLNEAFAIFTKTLEIRKKYKNLTGIVAQTITSAVAHDAEVAHLFRIPDPNRLVDNAKWRARKKRKRS